MAFIELTNYNNKYPILFNVEYIEVIEPQRLDWKHSISRIYYRESFYDVSESFAQVTKLIEGVSAIGATNLEGEVYVTGRIPDGN